MISTPLQRLYFRSVLCPYEENAGPSTRPGSQKSNAEFVLLHHDVISGIRRLSTGEMRLEWLAESDLLKHILVDENGGYIPILLPLIVWLTKSLWIHSRVFRYDPPSIWFSEGEDTVEETKRNH